MIIIIHNHVLCSCALSAGIWKQKLYFFLLPFRLSSRNDNFFFFDAIAHVQKAIFSSNRALFNIAWEWWNTKRNMNKMYTKKSKRFSKISYFFLYFFGCLSFDRLVLYFIDLFRLFSFFPLFFKYSLSCVDVSSTITTTTTIVSNAFNRTVIWIIIWRFTQAIECGNIWCGSDYEHVWCNDEFFRFICGTIAERIFLS